MAEREPDSKALGVPEVVKAILRESSRTGAVDYHAALDSLEPIWPEIHRAVVAEERERYQPVVAAARFLVDRSAGHPSRPSAQRSCWQALERALAALNNQADNQGEAG